jgi:hypothetical protein
MKLVIAAQKCITFDHGRNGGEDIEQFVHY